ncbi:MAG TPA: hypothetical protein ENN58_00165 [bacterium]|nr:hypothetical protein [bacterium]
MISQINKLCSTCRQPCKQSSSAKIIFCPMFEVKRSDLRGQEEEGKGNVSTTGEEATQLKYERFRVKILR